MRSSYLGNTNLNTILSKELYNIDITSDTPILSSNLNILPKTREHPVLTLSIHCSFSDSGTLSVTRIRNGNIVTELLNNGNKLTKNNLYSFSLIIKNNELINFTYSVSATLQTFTINEHYGIINIPQSNSLSSTTSDNPYVVDNPTYLVIVMFDSSSSVSTNTVNTNTINYIIEKIITQLKSESIAAYLCIGSFETSSIAKIGTYNSSEFILLNNLNTFPKVSDLSYSTYGTLYNTINYYINNSPLNPMCIPKVFIISDFESDITNGDNIIQMNQDGYIGLQLITLKNNPCTYFHCPCSATYPLGPKRAVATSTSSVDRLSFSKMLWCNKRPSCSTYTGVDILRIDSLTNIKENSYPCIYTPVEIDNGYSFDMYVNDGNVTGIYVGKLISYDGTFDTDATWNHVNSVVIDGTTVNDFLMIYSDYTSRYDMYRYNGQDLIANIKEIINIPGDNVLRFWYWNFCNLDVRASQRYNNNTGGYIPYLFIVYDSKATLNTSLVTDHLYGYTNPYCSNTIPWK